MGKANAAKVAAEGPFTEKSNVAVIGGGIAGITAAIKLYRQGYKVTLFEKSAQLGGNMSSNSKDDKGKGQDVYPHIFADWYNEFWFLLEEDLGLPRHELFKKSHKIHMAALAKQGDKPVQSFDGVEYATLSTPTNLEKLMENLQSGALSGRDMLLFGHSFLDIASAPTEARRSKLVNELDVNGYLSSRPYMNDPVATFHDDTLKVIWSVPAEQTSAAAYQKLLRHTLTFPKGTPFAWFLTGPLYEKLMKPIEGRLRLALGDRLKMRTTVTELELDAADKFAKVSWTQVAAGGQTESGQTSFDYIVIATPPEVTAHLVLESKGANLAERHPLLARLREAQTGRIPIVHLYFKKSFWKKHEKALKHLPSELTGFRRRGRSSVDRSRGSTSGNYDISMLNIAAVWDPTSCKASLRQKFDGEPVLLLAASQAEAIAGPGPQASTWDGGKRQALAMLKRLKEYFEFIDLGDDWETGNDIDWDRTRIVSNKDHLLFLNTVASDQWRPNATLKYYKRSSDKACSNVFFAGDYCMTPVDMATVEAATQSGVLAARALMFEHDKGHKALPLQPHRLYTTDALVLAKLASTPAAFAAALTAVYDDAATNPRKAATLPASAAILAASYWADWLRSAEHLVRLQMPGYRRAKHKEWDWRDVHPQDETLGVLHMAANMALALAVEGSRVAPEMRESAAEAIYQGWRRTVGHIYFPDLPDSMREYETRRRRENGDDDDEAPLPAKWDFDKAPTGQVRESAQDDPDERPPSGWSKLFGRSLDGGTVGATVANTAFGAVTTGVRLISQLKDEFQGSRPAQPLGDHIKEALTRSLKAAELNATGYRYYDPPRDLPEPDPPE